MHNSYCQRTCGYTQKVTENKIKCKCVGRNKVCTYQIRVGRNWLDWKARDATGTPYVPFDQCVPTTPVATTTTPMATTTTPVTTTTTPVLTKTTPAPTTTTRATVVSNWNEWASWGACSATCGAGERVRKRTCQDGSCTGSDMELSPCVDYRSTSCGPTGQSQYMIYRDDLQFS